MQEKDYIQMLIQSLEKKIEALEKIQTYNIEQNDILQQSEVDFDAWEATVDKKGEEIDKIAFYDEGFENVYQRVKEMLETKREAFKEEIKTLQKLITKITELTVNVQVQEERNKQLAQTCFTRYKKQSRQFKENKKVLNVYRNQMRQTNVVDAQFLDKKN